MTRGLAKLQAKEKAAKKQARVSSWLDMLDIDMGDIWYFNYIFASNYTLPLHDRYKEQPSTMRRPRERLS